MKYWPRTQFVKSFLFYVTWVTRLTCFLLYLERISCILPCASRFISPISPQVVRLALNPHPQTLTHPGMILVNVGDPLRKNTLCVELSPTGSQVTSAWK